MNIELYSPITVLPNLDKIFDELCCFNPILYIKTDINFYFREGICQFNNRYLQKKDRLSQHTSNTRLFSFLMLCINKTDISYEFMEKANKKTGLLTSYEHTLPTCSHFAFLNSYMLFSVHYTVLTKHNTAASKLFTLHWF